MTSEVKDLLRTAGRLHRLRRRAFVAGALCLVLGCAASPDKTSATGGLGGEAVGETAYVVAAGWHTEVGLPVEAIRDPLATLRQGFPGARYLIFGWGQKDYYMDPHPGLGELMAAALPGPAVMLITPLTTSPAGAFIGDTRVFEVRLPPAGMARLSDYLWRALEKNDTGTPHRIAAGPFPGSAFYASTRRYDLANTCNTFTADALAAGGLPVSSQGVVFAHQVTDQLKARPRTPPQ